MSSSTISMVEARLPPGFRFHPRDDELVLDYLCRKLSGKGGGAYGGVAMVDVDLNKLEPWELPDEACVGGRDWYFFSLHDRKYATGQRTNRATRSGYWKATGKDRPVVSRRRGAVVVGMRKTLVFYHGRAPRGSKTEWVMHEFRVDGAPAVADAVAVAVAGRPGSPPLKEDWVLCKVFYKNKSRTVTTPRPAVAADVDAGSLSKNELLSLPMLHMLHVDAYAFDPAPAAATVGGLYYLQQDADDADADALPAAAQQARSLAGFTELLTGVAERGVAKAEPRHLDDWTEAAAYAQHSAVSSSQTWNPFLSSG